MGSLEVIERAPQRVPPIYQARAPPGSSPLRRFVALPEETLLILGARRARPVISPTANTNSAVSIHTSVGFRQLETEDYLAAAQSLQPDVLIGAADIVYDRPLSHKRREKMTDRTVEWTVAAASRKDAVRSNGNALAYEFFAPLLPVPHEVQSYYLDTLANDVRNELAGLTIFDPSSIVGLPDELDSLPRLLMGSSTGPSELLHEISLGADLITVPFVGTATDAGIALDFSFRPPCAESGGVARRALGIDLWHSRHATDLSPLRLDCACYACQMHHNAYVHHLLHAKEMLAWCLLQIHNCHVLNEFFSEVRSSVSLGMFDRDQQAFERYYERELPEQSGQGPRLRGYQLKTKGPGEPKLNSPAYRMLDETHANFDEDATLVVHDPR